MATFKNEFSDQKAGMKPSKPAPENTNTNEINYFPPHSPLPLKGGGLGRG